MFEALTKSFPMALGLALSPGPVLAIILLLMTPRAKTNATSFLLGWMLGILVIGTVIILMPGVVASHGGLSDHTGIVKVIFGIMLLISAILIWKRKPKSGVSPKSLKIFNNIDEFGMGKSIMTGFLFSAFSIKNIALSASGAAHIDATSLIDYLETLSGLFLFSLIASFTIIIPILIYFILPKKMEKIFHKWKDWLIKNNTNIMITMLLIFGALLIYIGLKIYLT